MKLNEAEMRMAYQIEATSQNAALNEIYMTWRYTQNQEAKDTAESLLAKLRPLSDKECIDGVLSETGVNVVKKHLEECDKCNQIYLEMEGELNAEISPEEQLALDGFKKVWQHTRKLKIAVGMVTGLLILLLLTIFLKIFVIGEPLSTHHITVTNLSYDEETGNLVINGMVNMDDYRVNRVVWKESAEDANAVNVIVYGADTLPFGQAKQDFTITIPDMKGKKAYFACPNYDQREVYNWKHYTMRSQLYQ